MKACKFCGKDLKDDARYCTRCGEEWSGDDLPKKLHATNGPAYEATIKPDCIEVLLLSALGVMAATFVAVIAAGIIIG